MHSSTSSSETGPTLSGKATGPRPVMYMVGLLALVAVALELIGTIGFVRVSRVQRRMDADYRAAIHLRPTEAGKPTLLILGNSLLLEGIDLPELQKETTAEYRTTSFTVEQTVYADWYYGMRRLFHEGAHPSVILLGLSINHLVADSIRGEYFAHFLMDLPDLPSVVRRQKLDPTPASDLLLANISGWVGSKTEIRNWLLGKTMPGISNLGSLLQERGPPPPSPARLLEVARPRLLELQQLCAQHGTRLLFVIPPSQDVREPYHAAEEAGKQAGVPVLVPYRPGEMPVGNYRDAYHLNPEGAMLFTARLASKLLNLRSPLVSLYAPPASASDKSLYVAGLLRFL